MRPSWICPRCGRSLRIANQEHVCGAYDLEEHFAGRDPLGRVTFDWMCDLLDSLGPYEILPMKTMFAFTNGVNFAFLKTRKRGVEVSVVLDSPPDPARFRFVCVYSRTKSIYKTLILGETELDADPADRIRDAFHLTRTLS